MRLFQRRYQENVKLQTTCKFIADVMLTIIFAYALISFTCDKTEVSGSSMMPQMENGNFVLVNKLAYTVIKPHRYSVIAFFAPNGSGRVYIKRVVGLPGETVQIKDKKVYINGRLLEDDPVKDEILTAGLAGSEITLKEGEYFVLGDNRNSSEDSRFAGVGLIQEQDILGSVWAISSPITKVGLVK